MSKKFLHKPTNTVFVQQDWTNAESEGDFSLITSHHLAIMSSEPYAITIIANLSDCIELDDKEAESEGDFSLITSHRLFELYNNLKKQ
jgi:hypothetical protein